jgi:hypothetical protein
MTAHIIDAVWQSALSVHPAVVVQVVQSLAQVDRHWVCWFLHIWRQVMPPHMLTHCW